MDGSFDQWGNKSAPFGLCISELYETRGAKQGVPYVPYGPPEVLIFLPLSINSPTKNPKMQIMPIFIHFAVEM